LVDNGGIHGPVPSQEQKAPNSVRLHGKVGRAYYADTRAGDLVQRELNSHRMNGKPSAIYRQMQLLIFLQYRAMPLQQFDQLLYSPRKIRVRVSGCPPLWRVRFAHLSLL